MKNDTLVLILAGGQSRRMGRDKAALPFGEDETMLTALVKRFQCTPYPVAVSVRLPGQFDTAGAPEIADLYPGQGPLAGLQAAFTATGAARIFLTGTDLPFLTTALAEAMLQAAAEGDADCWVVQRRDGKTEPLCGVYSRRCLPALEESLQAGRRSFKAFFRRVDVHYVREDTLPGFDLEHLLDNLNTPEDYSRAVHPAETHPS